MITLFAFLGLAIVCCAAAAGLIASTQNIIDQAETLSGLTEGVNLPR